MSTAPQTMETVAERLDKLYEFERAPVTPDRLHSGRYFAAMFAGEHVAGTEFVIGAMFVAWGATAKDLVLGLAIGNLLAVLSWAFICAPIATRVRLTLYWYARRIIGPGLTVVYNIVNALLYCFLAAAMIGVSASAVGLAIHEFGLPFEHPSLDDVYPNSVTWVVIVLLVGAVVIGLAVGGFKKLSQFAAVCSPWMFPIFLAGAIATLPRLGSVNSAADIWQIFQTQVWNGEPLKSATPAFPAEQAVLAGLDGGSIPDAFRQHLASAKKSVTLAPDASVSVSTPGELWRIRSGEDTYVVQKYRDHLRVSEVLKERLGFWHILFFAWFCNLAMHVGLSDMAVFRYAKHWSYGFYSAFGMFLGHYFAWMCAGIMGAVIWGVVNPGLMAWEAAGLAGLLCVLIAGWTTANPTIYRAGLALQIITPNWPRWLVTVVAGGITTIVACFPAIFMKLLDFVAIYGLVLMPIGAIIVTEFWLFPKLGLTQYWTDRRRRFINGPALIAWAVVMAICFPFENFFSFRSPMAVFDVHLFFRWLPGWFIASILYTVLCMVWPNTARGLTGQEVGRDTGTGASTPAPAAAPASPVVEPAKTPPLVWAAGAVAVIALGACLILPIRVFLGGSDPAVYEANMRTYKTGLLIATIVYFVAAIYWESKREAARETA